MPLNFENDRDGLAEVVARARVALLPFVRTLEADLDTVEAIRQHSAPFQSSPRADASWMQRRIKGAVELQKNRLLWREQQAFELAAGLLQRLVVRSAGRSDARRPSLLVVMPYDVADRTTGGANRLYGLARRLARTFDLRVLSLVGPNRDPDVLDIHPGVTLCTVPRTAAFMEHVDRLRGAYGGAAELLAMHDGGDRLPLFAYWIESLGREAAGVIVNGPPLLPLLRERLPGKPVIHDSHDVFSHFARLLAGGEGAQAGAAFAAAAEMEAAMMQAAALVACASESDRQALVESCGISPAKTLLVSNGIDAGRALYFPPDDTRRLQRFAGIAPPVALFVGSCHRPNLDAVRFLIRDVAPRFAAVRFVVMGMSCSDLGLPPAGLPANLTVTGKLSEPDKEAVFALADVALCPVDSGSGSSLKIPDYAAHGKPVVSTAFGVRGFDEIAPSVAVAERDGFAAALQSVLDGLAQDPAAVSARCAKARRAVETHYDWSVIADRFLAALLPALGGGA